MPDEIEPGDHVHHHPCSREGGVMWEHLKAYGYAPGNYTGQCFTCCKMFTDLDKRAIRCKACAEKMHAEATPPAQPADSNSPEFDGISATPTTQQE